MKMLMASLITIAAAFQIALGAECDGEYEVRSVWEAETAVWIKTKRTDWNSVQDFKLGVDGDWNLNLKTSVALSAMNSRMNLKLSTANCSAGETINQIRLVKP
jgi:hypothetical protein